MYVCLWSRNLNNDAVSTRVGLLHHREKTNIVVLSPTVLRDFYNLRKLPDLLRDPLSLLITRHLELFAHESCGVKLTTQLYLAPSLRMSEVIPPLPHAVISCTETTLLIGSNSPVG